MKNNFLIFLFISLLSLVFLSDTSVFAQSAFERARIGKVSIDCGQYFRINDYFVRRIPRILHISIDQGVFAMLEEGQLPQMQISFENVLYQNKPMCPSIKNQPHIKKFYEELENEQKIFLRKFCQGENGLDILLYWDECPPPTVNEAAVLIAAYDRTNNTINFRQLAINREKMMDANKMRELVAEYTKQFAHILKNSALR